MVDWRLEVEDQSDVIPGLILLESLSQYALKVELSPGHRADRVSHAINVLGMKPDLVYQMSDAVLIIASQDEFSHLMNSKDIPERQIDL